MPQSLAQIYVHVVFSTKDRAPWLEKPLRSDTHAYLGGICRKLQSPPLQIGGVADHVHLLARISKNITPVAFVKEIKSRSSRWIKTQLGNNRNVFAWQTGYGLFSISPGHVDELVHYIQNQEAHHQVESYQEEMRRFFAKYDVPYDEKYVWD